MDQGLGSRAAQLSLRHYGPDADPHAHDDFDQIVLPRRGVLEMEIDGRGGRVQAGQAALVRCGTRHAFAARGDNLFVVANIGADLIAPFEDLRDRAFLPVNAPVRGLLDFICGDAARQVEDAVAALWAPLLLRGLAVAPPRIDPRLARAAALIERDFARPLSVRDLAAEAGMSQSRLFAGFAAAYGWSPHACLADTRLRAAQRLLSETALSIAEIALRTGHADQSALTRGMKARLGTTPGAWRKRPRG
ncbi:DNA-binding domain-containing protein, AraC-type [Caulobacter sp. AP07]|uniref:AraC family transcriptional regulator n=1 Tax=Caulobacter sp. AP07 TaxID=1144304 RepID=UPI000271F82C|nr:AraC family transcriptional regulator [Caulobacter sp. AP07]EJL22700.1 DNA-binding domain-containing protein, AraC-type [Caulobacter sp. AP07]